MMKTLLAASAVLVIGLTAVNAQDYRREEREREMRREHREYCARQAQYLADLRSRHLNRKEREEVIRAEVQHSRECRR